MLLAAAVAILLAMEDMSNPTMLILLFMAWAVDGAAAFYLAGTLSQQWEWRSRGTRTLMKLLLGIISLLVASVVFLFFDDVPTALAIAGGPSLVLAVVFGVYFSVLILAGRNARWN
jgi:peptidoglycan/LPS O-acetylase OafA/YrhL